MKNNLSYVFIVLVMSTSLLLLIRKILCILLYFTNYCVFTIYCYCIVNNNVLILKNLGYVITHKNFLVFKNLGSLANI